MIALQYAMPHLFHENKTNIDYKAGKVGNFIGPILYIIAQTFGQQIPDCLMICVGRLYYTGIKYLDCFHIIHLYVTSS